MSTNSNLQQINVFNKGMNTDTSDAYLSSELYRYAENLRFITDTDENSGELRPVEGYLNLNWIELDRDVEVICSTVIRDFTILLVNCEGCARIWVFNKDLFDHCPFFDDNFLWDSNIKYSVVTRWEADNNVKLYIADGQHELMSLNICLKDSKTIKNINVLTNNIQIPEKISVEIDTQRAGNLKCPIVLYYYYLYTPNGNRSDLSTGSKVIRLYKDGNNSGYRFDEFIGKSIKIEIKNDSGQILQYDRIRIYRVEYKSFGEQPLVYVICDEEVSFVNNKYTYIDDGSYLYSEAVSEFLSNVKYRLSPKIIESKNDILFAANTCDVLSEVDKLFKNFSFNPSTDVNLISCKYKINSNGKFISGQEFYGPSLMRGETYRYGVIFYLKDGRKSSVFHLCDYTVPENLNIVDITASQNVYEYEFTRLGLSFNIRIPNEALEECSGYEITRCERTTKDSKTLFQGIIGATFGKYGKDLRYASNYMTLLNLYKFGDMIVSAEGDQQEFVNNSFSDITTFASPEVVYQPDDVELVVKLYEGDLYIHGLNDYTINTIVDLLHSDLIKGSRIIDDYGNLQLVVKRGGENNGKLYVNYLDNADQYTSILWEDTNVYYRGLFLRAYSKTETSCSNPVEILNTEFVRSPDPYNFNNDDNIVIDSDLTTIGNKLYVNWDAHAFFRTGEINVTDPVSPTVMLIEGVGGFSEVKDLLKTRSNNVPLHGNLINISTGKTALLLHTSALNVSNDITNILPMSVVNIKRHNVVPYGGTNDSAMATSVYYSHGDYQDVSDGNIIDVWSGDIFSSLFIYNSAHVYCSDRYFGLSVPTVYAVPIESKIDLLARYGDLFVDLLAQMNESNQLYNELQLFGGNNNSLTLNDTKKAFLFLDSAGVYYSLTQDKDAYLYDTAYSKDTAIISYVEKYLENLTLPSTDTRIHYSDVKTNGELIDSWTNFKAMNFLDVDSRYGEITGLRLFKNSLIYWQDNATGVLAVNERTMLQDVNDTNIILGNGDVLQRYDYLSLKYGMAKNQLCDAQSDGVLYWWDLNNRDLIMYPGGQFVLPMKLAKTVSNIINKHSIENPTLAYDNKYKELLFSGIKFKIDGEDCIKSLVYNEMISLFTSIYDIKFQHKAELNDRLLLIDDVDVLQWNVSSRNLKDVILRYVVNDKSTFTKVYDNLQIGMGDPFFENSLNLTNQQQSVGDNILNFVFNTTNQQSDCSAGITSREYDLRLAIPRDGNAKYGNRMRGKTMQCELTSSSTEFSLQYIITKYRISWS